MQRNQIIHLAMGGTIVGCVPEYSELEYIAQLFTDFTAVDKFVTKSFKASAKYSSYEICRKDSRDVDQNDRSKLLQSIIENYNKGCKRFLITHGTYTMPDTGMYLQKNLSENALSDISVVITGAMYPWSVLGSDAPMNVGASLSSLINQNALGVVINMHGRNWNPSKIEKNEQELIFEEV